MKKLFLGLLLLISIPAFTLDTGVAPIRMASPVVMASPTPMPTASTLEIAANPARRILVCQNFGTTVMVVKFGAASSGQYDGQQIPAGSGFLWDVSTPGQAVYVNSLTSTGTGTCTEGQ